MAWRRRHPVLFDEGDATPVSPSPEELYWFHMMAMAYADMFGGPRSHFDHHYSTDRHENKVPEESVLSTEADPQWLEGTNAYVTMQQEERNKRRTEENKAKLRPKPDTKSSHRNVDTSVQTVGEKEYNQEADDSNISPAKVKKKKPKSNSANEIHQNAQPAASIDTSTTAVGDGPIVRRKNLSKVPQLQEDDRMNSTAEVGNTKFKQTSAKRIHQGHKSAATMQAEITTNTQQNQFQNPNDMSLNNIQAARSSKNNKSKVADSMAIKSATGAQNVRGSTLFESRKISQARNKEEDNSKSRIHLKTKPTQISANGANRMSIQTVSATKTEQHQTPKQRMQTDAHAEHSVRKKQPDPEIRRRCKTDNIQTQGSTNGESDNVISKTKDAIQTETSTQTYSQMGKDAMKPATEEIWKVVHKEPVQKETKDFKFPLNATHEFDIRCSTCLNGSITTMHTCTFDTLFVKEKGDESWIKVRQNKNKRNAEQYWICRYYKSLCKFGDRCRNPHSEIEKQLWQLEAQKKFNINDFIVHHSRNINSVLVENDPQKALNSIEKKMSDTSQLGEDGMTEYVDTYAKKDRPVHLAPPATFLNTTRTAYKGNTQNKKIVNSGKVNSIDRNTWCIHEICGICWKNGAVKSKERNSSSRCEAKSSHSWIAAYISETRTEIRQPPNIAQGGIYKICSDIEQNKKCNFRSCKFAHNNEELTIWQRMKDEGVEKLSDIAKVYPSSTSTLNQKQQVSGDSIRVPLPQRNHHCPVCDLSYQDGRQLNQHQQSNYHRLCAQIDDKSVWNYRPPPWSLKKWMIDESCTFADVEDSQCQHAHSSDEFDEWQKRKKYREQALANQDNPVYVEISSILEEYNAAKNKQSILAESMKDIHVECDKPNRVSLNNKQEDFTWKFTIEKTEISKKLEKVYLLLDEDRHCFRFAGRPVSKDQQLEKIDFPIFCTTYEVTVVYKHGSFGSFSQWVVFDFGEKPHLMQKLHVDVGSADRLNELQEVSHKLDVKSWTLENTEIIPYTDQLDDRERELLAAYRAPEATTIVNFQTFVLGFSKDNYAKKMHTCIALEELERNARISELYADTSIKATSVIQEDGVFINAPPGELFAVIKLPMNLNRDTDRGRLIMMSVPKVLLKCTNKSEKVYEALILTKDKYDFDGKHHDSIYISLSTRCVEDWQVETNTELDVSIQFQVDRLPFCKWHKAIDAMSKDNLNIIFPPPDIPVWNALIDIRSEYLNDAQMKVVRRILEHDPNCSLPIIVYGPFGTGKTETLAQATRAVYDHSTTQRCHVLICTHSNSAADLYIEWFHDCGKIPSAKVKRLYHKQRRINTVSATVQLYCWFSENKTSFRMPNASEVKECNIIVVTLTAAFEFLGMLKKGHFTHIFIDEAAQALESEILIPIALASRETCVVLTGDHQQTTPKIYSPEAKKQGFDKSIIENVMKRYKSTSATNHSSCILLNYNYRTSPGILQFLSSTFYGKPDSIISCSPAKPQNHYPGLNFYAAMGEETSDVNTNSWFNMAEVDELVVRISDLVKDGWTQEKIRVIASEDAQVRRLRHQLRKCKMSSVNVGDPMSVQGREFDAVFISTVRRHKQGDDNISDLGDLDLGFLTDSRLLNTCISRSKYFVGVVGDPITLCTRGTCAAIWRKYIDECLKQGGAHPRDNIIKIMQSVQESKSTSSTESNNDIANEIEADEILQQLASHARDLRQTKPATRTDARHTGIIYKKIWGHVVPVYQVPPEPKRKLIGEQDADREYDSDSSGNAEMRDDFLSDKASIEEMQNKLVNEGDIYKRCILNVYTSHKIRASVINPYDDTREIVIPGRRRCGHAFDGDEVCVRIMPTDEEDMIFRTENANCEENLPRGTVIGVLQSNFNPKYRTFICSTDDANSHLIPMNSSYPVMQNVANKADVKKRRKHRRYICVYKLTNDERVVFSHYESTTLEDGSKTLFLVRYLKWDPGHAHPLCIVIKRLPQATTMSDGLALLDIEYFVPTKIKNQVKEYATKSAANWNVQDHGRCDKRNLCSFTIDPDTCNDMDDALSIENNNLNGLSEVGIHIADVSYFVQKDSILDKDARSRCITFYPAGKDPIPMLPEILSTDVSSLKENQDRKTISVFLSVSEDGQLSDIRIERCLIRSQRKLTYEEAEILIDSPDTGDNVQISIKRLHKLAEILRKQRLGNESLYHNLEVDSLSSVKSHLMIQEFMIMANNIIGSTLTEHYPECSPLRAQMPPNEMELDAWKKRFHKIGKCTVSLKKEFLPHNTPCMCRDECQCISGHDNETVSINTIKWLQVTEATDINLYGIADHDILPEATVAKVCLNKIQEKAAYVCSRAVAKESQRHYSLRMESYTHFTSPIRRYIDLIVHRLLVALLEDKPCPYSTKQIAEICRHCSESTRRANNYQLESKRLKLAVQLDRSPERTMAVVDDCTSTGIKLVFPEQGNLLSKVTTLKIPHIKPHSEPIIESNMMKIDWRTRIYDASFQEETEIHRSNRIPNTGILRSDMYTALVPINVWDHLMTAIRIGDMDLVRQACRKITEKFQLQNTPNCVEDVSSECQEIIHTKQVCAFSTRITNCSVLQVQLSSSIRKGFLVPAIQLLHLGPRIKICLEHSSSPISCFADTNNNSIVNVEYRKLDDYVDGWLHCLKLEGITSTVREKSLLIHNVDIKWTESTRGDYFIGHFYLDKSFCQSRFIEFTCDENHTHENISLDLFCVRYNDVTGECGQKYTWVGHCTSYQVSELETTKEDISSPLYAVELRLLKYNGHKPTDLGPAATVEFMQKVLPIRIEEQAIRSLGPKHALALGIALKQKIPKLRESHVERAEQISKQSLPVLPQPNERQVAAIRQALTQPFTLIQGPPGTGKTVTGVRLAYLFAQFNKGRAESNPQILICGPSNDSVDVIAKYLLQLGGSLSIVRVYSSIIEYQDYPLPLERIFHQEKQMYMRDSALNPYALHHMIRNPGESRHYKKIRKIDRKIYDLRMRNMNEDLSVEEKFEYFKLIQEAKCEVLKKKEIILCTCHVAKSGVISTGTNIKQVIIDECGMCTEPQSMVPIVSVNPEQVVLLGDHKQLQPIILDQTAKNLGLGKSLFERYAENAHMLTHQYRMQEKIAEFPSNTFYDGKLERGLPTLRAPSGLQNFWPGGKDTPIMFIHVVGLEESLSVSTAEGSEQSKSNMAEVQEVVRVVTHLLENYQSKKSGSLIRQEDILVMSQYRAQCAKIQAELEKVCKTWCGGRAFNCDCKNVKVNTVVASQGGERDYIVWSTVRSLPKYQLHKKPSAGWSRKNLGFTADEHQVNVALTRAKKGLIIIGNMNLLGCNPVWDKLLAHYKNKKAVIKASEFLPGHRYTVKPS